MIKKKNYVTPKSGIRISNQGIFDFKKLCDEIKSWGNSRHYDFTEKEHKIKKETRGDEIEFHWIFERKIDDYTQFTVNVDFFITDTIKVKVGNKTLEKANMEIILIAFMDFDYREKWTGLFKEFLLNIYNNYLIKEKIKNVYEVNLYKELMELHDNIKESLEMYK